MRILITGGAGFIGSNLAAYLAKDHEVTIVDNFSGGYASNIPDNIIMFPGDILDGKLESIFEQEKFDYVYHFAAYAAEGLSHHIRMYNYQNNVVGSTAIINLCVKYKVKRLIFASSIAVYGNELMDESTNPKPIDPYGVAKLAVEMDLQIAEKYFGLNYSILRLHNVYGPKQNIWDKYRNVIGIFIKKAEAKEPLTIFGDGNQTRCFTYIEDILPILSSAMHDFRFLNRTLNIGSDKQYSINELIEIFKTWYPDLKVSYLRSRHEVNQAQVMHNKFHQTLTTPLVEGIKRMLRWYESIKLNPGLDYYKSREDERKIHVELKENLPEGW
jgi:UDP-glucose 4-epimerase